MAFNTGNPVGSRSPKDLLDNSENLDELVNSPTKTKHPDRLGVDRKTWHGMEVDFQQFMNDSAYQPLGDYDADGPFTIEYRNQVFIKDGEYYRASAGTTLPYTTSNWAADEANFVAVGDAVLRQDLSAPGGVFLVKDAVAKVANTTELRALTGLVDGQEFDLQGHQEPGDGGGSPVFVVGDESGESDDDGYTFIVDGKVIRRRDPGAIPSPWFNVPTDGVADARARLGAAGDAGAALVLHPGTYRIAADTTIDVPVTFLPGAVIKPDSGVTFVCEAALASTASQQIYDLSAGGFAGARSTVYPDRRAYGFATGKPACPFAWEGSHPLPSVLYIGPDSQAVYEAYDVADFAPPTDADVYVSWGSGDNGTGDGSIGAPYKTIVYAQQQVEADGGITAATFYVDAATPQFRSNPQQGGNFSKDVVFKPYNGQKALFISSDDHSSEWASHSGDAYVVTRSAAKRVVDRSNPDSDGDWQELQEVGSAATVVSTPGSWYTDGTDVYVHAFDSRDLTGDTDMFVLIQSGGGTTPGGSTCYMEDCQIFGFNTAMGGGINSVFLNKNCEFKHQVLGDAVISSGGEVYSQGAVISGAFSDGFSYGASGGGDTCIALEIECVSRKCGLHDSASVTHNATTVHAESAVVRINGDYSSCRGPVVADVGGGLSWVVGCDSHDSRAPAAGSLEWRQRSNYYCQDGHMWIEGGSSLTVTETATPSGTDPGDVIGSVYDLSPDRGYIYVRGLMQSHRVDTENTEAPQEILEF